MRRIRSAMSVPAMLALALAASAQDGVPSFSEQAAAAGVFYVHTNPTFFTSADYTAGGTVGDFDRDGTIDLFGVSGGVSRDHLFLNDGDGTFTDRALEWGLTVIHSGKGATTGDYNDDGWLDIYQTSAGPVGATAPGHHKLFRNNGNSSFTNVATAAGVNATNPGAQGGFGSAFGDYDLDSDLDLFVAGFSSSSANTHSRIFRNDGDGTFTDVTTAINFWGGTSIAVSGFSPRFADMTGDRYPELLLGADFHSSRYFRNNANGTFTDVTTAVGANKDENGMGHTVGDWNRDGLLDWYVTSIYWPSVGWTGNKLYWNTPSGNLTLAPSGAGMTDGGYGWGAVSVDLDHDGWQDIVETNGDNGTPLFFNEPSYVYMNDGDGTFTESHAAVGLNYLGAGRGMTNLDYDDDGDQDVVIFTNFGPVTLWRNDLSGTQVHWLRVFLDTTANDELAADGYGAVVKATAGGVTQYRQLTGGDNFQSCSELSAHFGLGASGMVDELRVEWSNGDVTVLANVPADQTLTVMAPEDDGWTRVGLATGGSNGVPQLRGQGALTAGSATTLTQTGGKPSATVNLLVSPFALLVPFKGGTLVPSPDLLIALAADGAGGFALGAPWPAGLPAGTQVWFQCWQADATGNLGWISTNGLRATTP
ncbi:MAG: CRTAC1 family protein [Planctomycetes bacterium]|nr:CRTAC1 family protein [Planctomycetota bacterium]